MARRHEQRVGGGYVVADVDGDVTLMMVHFFDYLRWLSGSEHHGG